MKICATLLGQFFNILNIRAIIVAQYRNIFGCGQAGCGFLILRSERRSAISVSSHGFFLFSTVTYEMVKAVG